MVSNLGAAFPYRRPQAAELARRLVRRTWIDLDARDTGLGVWLADVPGSDRLAPGGAVDFTFWWPEVGRWEGRDLRVEVSRGVDRR